MNEKIKECTDILIDNWNILKKIFKKDHDKIALASATIFLQAGVAPDVEKIKMCEDFVLKNTGRSSEFRGMMRMPMVCKMSLQEKPGIYFEKVQHICELMKTYRWLGDDTRVTAAMIIADCSEGDAHDDANLRYYLNETDAILNALKDKFGKRLSEGDYAFAAMLAASDYEIEPLVDDAFSCYDKLSPTFKDGGVCRAMAFIMSLADDEPYIKKDKLIGFFQKIEESEFRFGRGFELTIATPFVFLENGVDELADQFFKTETYLRMDKHCRGYTMKPNIRNMYAALMTYVGLAGKIEDLAYGDVITAKILLEASVIAPSSSSVLSFGAPRIK